MNLETKVNLLKTKIKNAKEKQLIVSQPGDTMSCKSPSNIALIKYWGKQTEKNFNTKQQPLNSSLSFTLPNLYSETSATTTIGYGAHEIPAQHTFQFNSEKRLSVEGKLKIFLNLFLSGWADEVSLNIVSKNNFPSSCGIASSASGYAAIVNTLSELFQLEKVFTPKELFFWKTNWARIGSGSACRSVIEGSFVCWELENNSEPVSQVKTLKPHKNFQNLIHRVVVLNSNEKKISSSEGHLLALSSPLHPIRLANIEKEYFALCEAIESGNFLEVCRITEQDAFAMHAIMMSASTPCFYFEASTTNLIASLIEQRKQRKIFWTVDAGPNVHILAHPSETQWLDSFLSPHSKVLKGTPL
jgi:diphosphomevalonate decarboxylase